MPLTEVNGKVPSPRTSPSSNNIRHKSPEVERRLASPKPTTKAPEPVTKEKEAPSPPPKAAAPPPKKESTPAPEEKDEDIIDMDIFQQILDLDEDDEEFSQEMVFGFFDQATQTFKDMDKALAAAKSAAPNNTLELDRLSKLGHFLKGSSAALGIKKVQHACEHIQHYGSLRDEKGLKPITNAVAYDKIASTVLVAKDDYAAAKAWFERYYGRE